MAERTRDVSVDQQPAEAVAQSCTPTETVLVDMWKKILWVPDVGLHDSFVDLGGHSLSATRCINRIRLLFHVDVSLDSFFVEPGDIATIAELIDRARHDRAE
jgi:acyl carrier protein